jgi:hypothetical protein
MAIWNILLIFGKFYGHLFIFFAHLVPCTKENLATLDWNEYLLSAEGRRQRRKMEEKEVDKVVRKQTFRLDNFNSNAKYYVELRISIKKKHRQL